jgi:hypothetical protein
MASVLKEGSGLTTVAEEVVEDSPRPLSADCRKAGGGVELRRDWVQAMAGAATMKAPRRYGRRFFMLFGITEI